MIKFRLRRFTAGKYYIVTDLGLDSSDFFHLRYLKQDFNGTPVWGFLCMGFYSLTFSSIFLQLAALRKND